MRIRRRIYRRDIRLRDSIELGIIYRESEEEFVEIDNILVDGRVLRLILKEY